MLESILTKEEIIRDEVIVASQKLFQRYGFQKTTMEDIAKAMGRGKSTLYYYYKSKEEIFEAVIFKEAKEVTSAVFIATEKVSSAEEKLKTYLLTFFKIIKEKVNLYQVMREELYENGNICLYQPSMKEPLKQFNTVEIHFIKDILNLGIENKEFAATLQQDIDVVSYVLMSSLRSVAIDLAFEENKNINFFLEENKVNAVINIFIKGLKY